MPEFLSSVRLYRPLGDDHVAVVAIQRASQPGMYLVQVARGPKRTKLSKGSSFGPVPEGEIAARYSEVVGSLRGEGFRESGTYASLVALKSKDSAVRARAAARLGWLREPDAVAGLLAALPKAVDDVCAIVDALGALGDPRAIPDARAQAARKLLSRRRSGAEALRNLGDAEGLAEVKNRALERLPKAVRAKLEPLDESQPSEADVAGLVEAVLATPVKDRGLAMDTLYEIATPAAVLAVRAALAKTSFDQAHIWRYVKSIYKRAVLRRDFEVFGLVAHAIEAQGRGNKGTTAKVKSGYDGAERKTRIFGKKTQVYMRRATFRFLRKLARHAPRSYAHAAAAVIVPYGPKDLSAPSGRYGAFADCYALVRVLFGGGDRFELDSRTLRFRFASAKKTEPPAGVREEAFPELWDEEPRAYLRVLAGARLLEAHQFAEPRVAGHHRAVLEAASIEEVLALVDAPYEPTVKLGVDELGRRFDPARPDWQLITKLAVSDKAVARDMAHRWIRLTAPLWTRDISQTIAFLRVPDAATRVLVAELLTTHLAAAPAELRRALAETLVAAFRLAEATPGEHDILAQVARGALLPEIDAQLTLGDLMHFITAGSLGAKAVAGDLLARRPEALAELGMERVVALAQHDVAAVRAAAHALVRGAIELLKAEPSLLFMLVESDWADTRRVAFDLLRTKIDVEALGLDGLIGLCDSNRTDVQDLGKELVRKHLHEATPGVPPAEVMARLVQHPHRNMRAFALDLAERYLESSKAALAKVELLCRAILFDLWPERRTKRRVIDFLVERGLHDDRQADVAAAILSDYVRTQGRADFERVMEGLVRIKLAYPGVVSAVHVLLDSGPPDAANTPAATSPYRSQGR